MLAVHELPAHDTQPGAQDTSAAASADLVGWMPRRASTERDYFTAPAVRPPTMYFCSQRKSTTTGSAESTAPAEKALQSA